VPMMMYSADMSLAPLEPRRRADVEKAKPEESERDPHEQHIAHLRTHPRRSGVRLRADRAAHLFT
jgi:hypothetical protein